MKYRPEIDGLRSVAVVPVILFHAGSSVFSGGFIGVDVFFVISGYLITEIILRELDQKRFSILKFYERRARRILPALFVVISACFPFGWFLMLPDPFENFAQSVVATLIFANNVLLNMTSGYWDTAAEFKPLLHTWSLGVEEQYYIVVPLLFWITTKYAKRFVPHVAIFLAFLSFAVCQFWMLVRPDHAFYMIDARAWELLVGSLVAIAFRKGMTRPNEAAALLGLAAVLGSIFLFGPETPFPGYAALLPVVGSAAVIGFGQQGTLTARLLSNRLLVWTGLISYSLYLWHQPMFAFMRIASVEEPSLVTMYSLIPLLFLLSYLTWRFVERPARNPALLPSKPASVVGAAGIAVFMIAIGVTIHVNHGFPGRIFDMKENRASDYYIAYNSRVHRFEANTFESNGALNLVVVGNSQARDFVNMMTEAGELERFNLVYRPYFDVCELGREDSETYELIRSADAAIFVTYHLTDVCWEEIEGSGLLDTTAVLFVGLKDFGYNLNAFGRVPASERADIRVRVDEDVVRRNRRIKSILPAGYFLDILGNASETGDELPVFDSSGAILSGDRVHVTKPGAEYFGSLLFETEVWKEFLGELEIAAKTPDR
ncbi:acyltransferase [Pseudoruegeria sp. HB172150]|uniref:acyltransferase family protein n=1 Tax=Pseudoruegeria sp. HB172150 TaxID=2721164 RepID=UPI001557D0A2|nr:acyltransferase [Pseudoruegeria sp. HB172150]